MDRLHLSSCKTVPIELDTVAGASFLRTVRTTKTIGKPKWVSNIRSDVSIVTVSLVSLQSATSHRR